jgi:hypothetical protein
MKGISQDFSDCGLHNGKYTKNQLIENCGLACLSRIFGIPSKLLHI